MKFQIRIVTQSWLDGSSPEQDLCSHGNIKLVIGGQRVTSGSEDFGISESALALLRTLESNHSSEEPIAQQLVFHGCGTILMSGCPIGVDWNVNHLNGRIRISDVVRYDGTGELEVERFSGLMAEMPDEEYRREIIAFANEAKQLFAGVRKIFADEFDRQQYEKFWDEYTRLLNRYEKDV